VASQRASGIIGSQQTLEPLKLVEDDEVRLECLDACSRKPVAEVPDERVSVPLVFLGYVLATVAEPMA
jgi:hypothetical protein